MWPCFSHLTGISQASYLSRHPSSPCEHRPRLHVSRRSRRRVGPGLPLVDGRPYSSGLHEVDQQVDPRDLYTTFQVDEPRWPPEPRWPAIEMACHHGSRPPEPPGIQAADVGVSPVPQLARGVPPLFAGAVVPHGPGPCTFARAPKTQQTVGNRLGLPGGPLRHSWSRPKAPLGPRIWLDLDAMGHG